MLSELQNWEISFAYIKLVIVWIQPYFNEDNVQAVLF